jgi:hypothetical protein
MPFFIGRSFSTPALATGTWGYCLMNTLKPEENICLLNKSG